MSVFVSLKSPAIEKCIFSVCLVAVSKASVLNPDVIIHGWQKKNHIIT